MSIESFSNRSHSGVRSEQQIALSVIAVVMIAAVFKVFYGTQGYYFFSDDFLNFIIAQDMGPTWRYLARDAQGEFIPLYRAINLIYFQLFGLAFWPFRVMLAAFQCIVILLIASMPSRRGLKLEYFMPLLAVIAFSPIFESSYQWWSAAINVLAEALMSLLAIRIMADVTPLTNLRKFLATLCYAASLCFFPKGLYVAVILLGVRLFASLERSEVFLVAIMNTAREVWPVFAAGAVYSLIVLLGHYASGVQPPSAAMVLHYIWHGWNHGFVIGVIGLDEGFFGRIALANLLVITLIAISVLRNFHTMALWSAFFLYFIAVFATIAVNRQVVLGLESSETSRYHADVLCFFVAIAMIACGRQTLTAGRPLHAHSFILSLVATLLLTIHLFQSSARVPPVWFVPPTRVAAFVNNVSASLRTAGDTRIKEGVVPEWVMPPWTSPLRQYSWFLTLFPLHGKIVVAEDALSQFDDAGKLVPVAPQQTSQSPTR